MRVFRLFLALVVSGLIMVSCGKQEGDVVPSVDKAIGFDVDSVTVFALSTDSEFGAILDIVTLKYGEVTELNDTVMKIDSIKTDSWQDVLLKKDAPFMDTLWEMKPNTMYAYCVYMEDFASSYTSDWKTVTTLNPYLPVVNADSAMMVNDTLWLYGTVTSYWRALMDEGGMGSELRFNWGTTQENVNEDLVDAAIVKDTLINGRLRLNITGFVLREEFQDAERVYYKAYAKHAWDGGEKNSSVKEIYVAQPGKEG